MAFSWRHPLSPVSDLALRVEQRAWSPLALAFGLAAIIAVRNLFEIMVGVNPVFTGLASFVHYPLAYVGPFLALTLVLAAWADVAPVRVARLMVLAWLLTLAPPLVDLVLHPGTEKPTIGYLQADPSDLGRIWTRFFDPRVALAGTTPGIRVEAAAAVVLGAVYVALRSRRWTRAAGAAVTIYATSLFFFSLPVLVAGLFRAVNPLITVDAVFRGEGVVMRGTDPANPDRVALFWLVPLVLALLAAWKVLARRHGEAGPPHEDAAPSPGVVLAFAGVAGFVAALWLHFPTGQPLVYAPYDALSLGGLVLALLLAGRALVRRDLLAAAAAAVLALGLGRSVAVGLAAAAGALAPLVFPALTGRARTLALVIAGPLATFAAFAAGFALVIGPEALARLPLPAAGPAAAAGLAIAAFAAITPAGRPAPAWSWPAVTGTVALLGVLLAGVPPAAVVALPLGLVGGIVVAGMRAWRTDRAAVVTMLAVAGFVALTVTRGLLATDFVREPWARAERCVPRLEIVRAQELERAGKWGEAEGAYRKALACDEDDLDAQRGLGLGWIRYDKKVDKGLAMLERLAMQESASALDLSNLGGVYLQVGRAADALPLLERAVALEPDRLNARFNLAQAYEDLGRRAEAIDAWRAYVERARRYPDERADVDIARRHLQALEGR